MIMMSIRVSTHNTARSTYSIRIEMERFRHENGSKMAFFEVDDVAHVCLCACVWIVRPLALMCIFLF